MTNYVLLDTNIIIDMVVDRRKNIRKRLLDKFCKLLEYDEIKMVVPEIVITETNRHLKKEIENVKKNIEESIKVVENLYGISTLSAPEFDIDENKENALTELRKARDFYDKNYDEFAEDVLQAIKNLFNHKNSIIIDDLSLAPNIFHRQIHQRAPFHKVAKESYGDATIAEALINLGNFIKIENDDCIFFVTGNYKDFSASNSETRILHPDIVEDLQKKSLYNNVVYVNSLSELIESKLKENVENAKLFEELREALEYEEEEYKLELHHDLEDTIREGNGFSSLREFEAMAEDGLDNSPFMEELDKLSKRYDSVKDKISDIKFKYEDDILPRVSCLDFDSLQDAFTEIESIYGVPFENDVCGVIALVDWIKEKGKEILNAEDDFEDFGYGKSVSLTSVDGVIYILKFEELDIDPRSFDSDWIMIDLTNSADEKKANAKVEINYGGITNDIDGGIDAAYEEGVKVDDDGIITKLNEIVEEWETYADEQEEEYEKIEGIFF